MSAKIRILYIDDYDLDRELVKDVLEKEHGGFQVTEASDKREFEALLKTRAFDVVLSDFNIAGFEGLQVLEIVRAYDPRIPVIIVTGTGSEEIAVNALKRGASDYVIKRPKHIQRLPQTILAAIEKQTLRDQRRKAELSLKESETRYRSLFENMMNGYCYCRMLFDRNRPHDFIYIDVNWAFESLTGLKNVVGKKVSEAIPGIQETDPELFVICGRVVLTGRPETFEMYIESLSTWFSISVYRPEKEHFVAVFDVITRRKQAEEALSLSEENLKKTANELRIRNRIAEVFLRVPDEEMCAKVLAIILDALGSMYGVFGHLNEKGDFVVPTMTRMVWEQCRVSDKSFIFLRDKWGNSSWPRAIREKRTICLNEPSTNTPQGHVLITRHVSLPIIHRNEVVGLIQVANKESEYTSEDIDFLEAIAASIAPVLDARLKQERQEAKRKRIEEALRKSEEKYRGLMEATADWVWTCDPKGRQTFANNAAKEILGYELHEIIGAATVSLMHPEDAKRVQKWFTKVVEEKKGWKNAVLRWKHKDGTTKFLESSARPILDSKGDLVGFAGIDRDVTERLRLEQQLLQTQKMEAIGTLAGGVAHDFNNLLSVILGNADLMLMELRKDHPFYNGIKEVRKAGTGAASLTRQLLAFSRQQVIQPEIINLNDVLHTTTKMLQRLIGENIDFQTIPDPALEPIEADSGQMEQVIINLAVNARDAMPTGGRLTVETKNLDLNEDFFKSQGVEGKAGRYVMLRVNDTGSGMDQELLDHIFDPFFTTKGIERGTGLGLSTVYGIVKQNNGHIFVDSQPGQGSAFEVYLPAAKGEKETVTAEIVTKGSLTGTETILVVEDDTQLQRLTSRILERYNYRVLQASSGDEALKVSQKHEGPINLILADVIMPGMNVREMAESIQSRRKETKTLYMSGHMDDTISHYGILEPGINFLQKPYTPEGLVRKIREVLDKKIDD